MLFELVIKFIEVLQLVTTNNYQTTNNYHCLVINTVYNSLWHALILLSLSCLCKSSGNGFQRRSVSQSVSMSSCRAPSGSHDQMLTPPPKIFQCYELKSYIDCLVRPLFAELLPSNGWSYICLLSGLYLAIGLYGRSTLKLECTV
jgi:hypothetical protein